jgi:hypothetical protein
MLRVGGAPAVATPQDLAPRAEGGDHRARDAFDDRLITIGVEQPPPIVQQLAKRAAFYAAVSRTAFYAAVSRTAFYAAVSRTAFYAAGSRTAFYETEWLAGFCELSVIER